MGSKYFGEFGPILEIVGAVSVSYVTLKVGTAVLRFLRRTIKRSLFPVDVKKYGRWAVVTGATSGIGKTYAFKLAERGMDIVLISRSADKLADVAAQIRDEHQVSVKEIAADVRSTDIYPGITKQLSGMDIGVLVNNVGMSSGSGYFVEVADNIQQFYKDMVNVNVMSCVMMTTAVLPGMLQRQRGAIINLSSMAGTAPWPFLATYSATKVFMRYLSEALNMEYSNQNITVQAVCPGLVQTDMGEPLARSVQRRKGLMYPTTDRFVTSALRTLGHESTTIGYWPHELELFFSRCLPQSALFQSMLKSRDYVHKTH